MYLLGKMARRKQLVDYSIKMIAPNPFGRQTKAAANSDIFVRIDREHRNRLLNRTCNLNSNWYPAISSKLR